MIEFTDKSSYLEAVASWKNQYAHLSKTIRLLKSNIFIPYHQVSWDEYHDLKTFKSSARDMLEIRKEGKAHAQLAWLSQKDQ